MSYFNQIIYLLSYKSQVYILLNKETNYKWDFKKERAWKYSITILLDKDSKLEVRQIQTNNYKRLILVVFGSKPRSLSLRSTSGGRRLSELNLLKPKWTVLFFMVWILGSKRHKGAPPCLFLIWVLSISAAKAIRWKWCCFERDNGVGATNGLLMSCLLNG